VKYKAIVTMVVLAVSDGLSAFAQTFEFNIVKPSTFAEPTGITVGLHRDAWFLGFGNNRVYKASIPH